MYIAIDEYWPGTQDRGRAHEGVIAGLVLTSGLNSLVGWPVIRNHVRTGDGADHRKCIQRVFAAPNVLPFVLPMRTVAAEASREYLSLVEAALLILLGWVLAPSGEKSVDVHVILGEIGGIKRGTTMTEHYAGFFKGLALVDPARFGGWNITEVRFTAGDEMLVAYADAVADLAHTHDQGMRQLAADIGLRQHPGYFAFSLDLLPRLLRLEQMERAGNVHDLLDLAHELHGYHLLSAVFTGMRRRLDARPELQRRLIEEINTRFDRSDFSAADLAALQAVAGALLPEPGPEAPLPLRALHAALQVQQANHRGAPEAIAAQLDAWRALSAETRARHPSAALTLELHLAVHLNDRLEFQGSEQLMSDWIKSGDLGLSPAARAWLRSSLGQSLAYQRRHEEAETLFAEALALIELSPDDPAQQARDRDQTGCYRALNALCLSPDTSHEALAAFLGGDLRAMAAQLATSPEPGHRYRHHLLLRWMYDAGTSDTWEAYRQHEPSWSQGDEHPWQWIRFYRVLLQHRHESKSADTAASDLWMLARKLEPLGAAMRFMASVMGTVSVCLAPADHRRNELRSWMEAARRENPAVATTEAIGHLEGVLAAPGADRVREALSAARFNFR